MERARVLWGIVNAEPNESESALRGLASKVSRERIIVADQGPANSASTLLSCFLRIFRSDPTAQIIAVLRHDRLIESPQFGDVLDRACAAADGSDNRMVLLATPRDDSAPASGLLRFASVLVANASAFLRLYETAHPGLLRALLARERSPDEFAMSVDPELLLRAPSAIKTLVTELAAA